MTLTPPQVQQVQVSHLALLAAVMFAARHKAYLPVPGEDNVVKEVPRLRMEVDLERGIAACLLDPDLLMHFTRHNYELVVDQVDPPGIAPPGYKFLKVLFHPQANTGLVLANGNSAGPDPRVVQELRRILG